jgi:hypothetical protein
MSKKKSSWIVTLECRVLKEIVVEGCTEAEAWAGEGDWIDERELECTDGEVKDVKPNKQEARHEQAIRSESETKLRPQASLAGLRELRAFSERDSPDASGRRIYAVAQGNEPPLYSRRIRGEETGVVPGAHETKGGEVMATVVVNKELGGLCDALAKAQGWIAELEAELAEARVTVFAIDPFQIIADAFAELWPHTQWPIVQWLPPGELHKDDDSPWGCTTIPDDGDEVIVSIDTLIPVHGAIDVLAHELAHVACHYLDIIGKDDEHDKNWEECFDKIHEVYERLAAGAEKKGTET